MKERSLCKMSNGICRDESRMAKIIERLEVCRID
jgi:hypothetical protein